MPGPAGARRVLYRAAFSVSALIKISTEQVAKALNLIYALTSAVISGGVMTLFWK